MKRVKPIHTLINIICIILISSSLQAAIDLDFSQKRGYYNSTFQLVIEADNPNATIRYTTNTSKPSKNNGSIYNGPITINRTTLLRVYAYTSTDESNVRTHSYIFVNETINDGNMYTYITQSSAYGSQMEASLKALPVISLVSNNIDGTNHIDTEKETSVEMFFPDNSRGGFMIHSGIQTWGGSPTNPKKNYRLEFKSIYGEPKLEYDLFKPDNYDNTEHPIQPVNKFDKLILRSGSQDGLNAEHGNENLAQYVRNRFLFDLQMEMGYATPHGRYVHVYVNGGYVGQYHILERPDAHFFEDYYGGADTDYEVFKSGEIWDGPYTYNNSVWRDLPNRINLSSQSNINNTNRYIDLDQAAAYMLLMSYASGFDWFEDHNCLGGGHINPGNGGYKFLLWDVDFAIGNGGRWDPSYAGNLTYFAAPLNQDGPLPNNLVSNLEFKYMMGDHMECTCYNEGILTTAKVDEAYMHRINQVKKSLIAESARWGDNNFSYVTNGGNLHVKKNQWDVNGEFTTELNSMRNSYLPNRTVNMINYWVNNGITSDLKGVKFNQYGGLTNQGFTLVLTNNNSNSSIYYTLDGSDPRSVGGGISGNATRYTGPVNLPNGPVTVKARVRDNNHSNNDIRKWSAMCPRNFYVNQDYSDLVINEIHYNPEDSIFFNPALGRQDTISGRNFEFIEIKNTGNSTINLTDVGFIKGVTVKFSPGMSIAANDFFMIAEDSIHFKNKYGFYPNATYIGKLSNSSENLWLVDPLENIIDSLRYSDEAPWDTEPDKGLYSLALRDFNLDNANAGSWAAQSVYVTPNAENIFCSPITINSFIADASCNGSNDGFISLSVSGGNSPYTYSWNTEQTTATVTNLSAGDYEITVTDALQCTQIETITIAEPNALQISISKNNQSYHQTNNGSATVSVNGGIPTYRYDWSNGATTSNINNLAPGNYSVTVTDANSCTKTENVNIDPVNCSNLHLSISKTDETYYQSNDGTALANVIGGKTPYNFSWSNGADTRTINNLDPGTYTVDITDSKGCPLSESTNIQAIDCGNISLVTSSTDETYFETNDGTALASVTNGVSPVTYSWSNGANTASVNNLAPGNYTVDLIDAVGCTASGSVSVQAIDCSTFSATASSTNETAFQANDGSATVNLTNGTSPFTYNWSNGDNTSTITNLEAGMYWVSITDKVGCIASASTSVLEVDCSTLNISTQKTDETLYQANDGTATISANGGTTPYSYNWSNGATTSSVNNLSPGNYTVTIEDALGCAKTEQITIMAIDCSNFNFSVNHTNETYYQTNDGTASVTVSNGASPYAYNWSNGETTASINNLAPNNYTVSVSDALGCSATKSFTIEAIDCSSFDVVVTTVDETYYQANDGLAVANTSNGTRPYSYSWSNNTTLASVDNLSPGNYSLLVTDALGCTANKSITIQAIDCSNFSIVANSTNQTYYQTNDGTASVNLTNGTSPFTYNWSSGAITQDINNLAAGSYAIEVTDKVGCKTTDIALIEAVDCSAFNLTIQADDESYYQSDNGSATANPANGASPYTYSWSNGANTKSINNLAPGSYTIDVTDNMGCPLTATTNIQAINCNSFEVSVSSSDETAFQASDGTASILPIDGTSPYTYNWSNGVSESNINNLSPGNYTVTITDAVGCSLIETVSISAISCTDFSININKTNETNFQTNDGTAAVTPVNGNAPYTYNWSNGSTTATVNNLAPGNYTITVTDALACSRTAILSIQAIDCDNYSLLLNKTDETYYQTNDGTASVNVVNGTAPYSYSWSNGTNNYEVSQLSPGSYSLQATDALGCTATESFVIEAINCKNFNVIIDAIDETYYQTNDGSAVANSLNGTSPYSYIWSNGSTLKSISDLSPGNYDVEVMDNLGCKAIASTIIEAIDCSNFSMIINAIDETYYQSNNGSASLDLTNGTAPFSYNWSNGEIMESANNLSPGSYTIEVTDNVGCSISEIAVIDAIDCSNVSLNIQSTNETYYQNNDGTATADLINGTSPYTYSWSNGATTQSINNLSPGVYSLDILDDVGCSVNESATIQAIDCSNFSLSVNATDETAFQANDGTAKVSQVNGEAPYVYSWSNGATTATINNLAPDTYTITTTDAVGCSSTESITVSAISCINFSLDSSSTDETRYQANDGAASVTPVNGNEPYTYSWSNGATASSLSNLTPGSYTVTVEDALNCIRTETFTIQAINCNAFDFDLTKTNQTYFQTNDGTATVSNINGTSPYNYAWSNNANTAAVSDLAPGNYTVSVSDALGCSNQKNMLIEAIDCSAFTATISNIDESYYQAEDGSATVNILNGAEPYIYTWSNGVNAASANNLAPGNYNLNVTDNIGCTTTENFSINALTCNTLNVVVETKEETCYNDKDGYLNITNISNGTSPYAITWSNGITAANNNNLIQGTYSLNITDALGCPFNENYAVEGDGQINSTPTITNASAINAYDGAIDLEVSGGIGPWY